MTSSAHLSHWDIFCNVIDNYGDIGVCWRLARQLQKEHGFSVRLFVDDLKAFQSLCPDIKPLLAEQEISNVRIVLWHEKIAINDPGDVVIETFACHLPENYIEAMAAQKTPPLWINLDYLSAENWTGEYHKLPSPHPKWPLTKYFFFPGFNEKTGGLLRESALITERETFFSSEKEGFRKILGLPSISHETLIISLFTYKNSALSELLNAWASGDRAIYCLVAGEKSLPTINEFSGKTLERDGEIQFGKLTLKRLPFIPQTEYDRLLWFCDINLVRGEDSFVRAQLAAKPMLWHIYPQDEATHLTKLEAFLDKYCTGLDEQTAHSVRSLHRAWNQGHLKKEAWEEWLKRLPSIGQHAQSWANQLALQDDLCTQLISFCLSKIK